MNSRRKTLYVPALRMKKGELEGLAALRGDVADCIVPLLIVPPVKERTSGAQQQLFPAERGVPDVGRALVKYWVNREVFIDPRALFAEYASEESAEWLPTLFRRARGMGVFAVPTAELTTLDQVGATTFQRAIDPAALLKFGLRIQSADINDPSFNDKVRSLLLSLNVAAKECAVLVDFSDADLSDHLLVAPIIRAALEQMQMLGQWQLIAFLGTHYPEKNPAKPRETVTQPRNEWLAWVEAVRFDPTTSEHMVFGDYAADCAKIDFKGKGGRPIPHTRYATSTSWLIVRGDAEGGTTEVMRKVFQRIVSSGKFAGADFSDADWYIFDVAAGNSASAGNATTWRQLNTTHHITQVVADLASVRRVSISRLPTTPHGTQQQIPNA